MWKILFLAILAAAIILSIPTFKKALRTNLALNTQITGLTEKFDAGHVNAVRSIEEFKSKCKSAADSGTKAASTDEKTIEGIVIHLKHGGVVSGKLLARRGDEYEVEGKTGKYVILKSQIDHVESKKADEVMWHYKHSVVVKKTSGVVLDGEIAGVDNDKLTMSFDEGGGGMEMAVNRKDVSHLIFAPICNKESADTEARLKGLFPKMSVYKEDNFTLLTDADPAWIKYYVKELNNQYAEIYFKFFDLFRNRKQEGQNFVILFDDPEGYIKYTVASLGPMDALGYFNPDDRTLFIYNGWGARIEKIYREYIERLCAGIDEIAKADKTRLDDGGWRIVVDGYAKEQKDVFWKWYNVHKRIALEETFEVMRHEFAHEIFHNWGLQGIVVSRPKVDKDAMAAKEREILDALGSSDQEKVEGVFKDLYKMKKDYYKDFEMSAANSWLAEGLACYCETSPIGAVNERFLAGYQEMNEKNRINPLEFLTNFKKGSFTGLEYQAVLDGYAESWGLAKFLVDKYPAQFIDYQKRMADRMVQKKIAAGAEDDFNMLLKCLGKDLPALENEFKEYMSRFEKVDDPFVKMVLEYEKTYDEFREVQQKREKKYIYFK
ncbi:MAG: hypothetical protein WC522_01530 [Candidatus Omnitrophota bacterium]